MAVSLRRTLAVRYSLTMAVALAGIALWAYWGMRQTLQHQLEAALANTFELQSLGLREHGRIPAASGPDDPAGFVAYINRLVLVRDRAGRLLQTNSELGRGIGIDSLSVARVAAGERVLRTEPWRGGTVRVLAGPVRPGGPPEAVAWPVR